MFCHCGLSPRKIISVIGVFNMLFDGIAGKAPSHQTIFDWVLKYGLSLSQATGTLQEKNRALIIDNSVNMNGQELHLELEAPATHPGHPLTHNDVWLVRMKVDKGWNVEMIKEQLRRATSENAPEYIVSDNAKTIGRACREMEFRHHRDISHSFGVFLERTYANTEELSEFNQKLGFARKYSHTAIGCLMPPKRRAYARFMNIFDRIDWAYSMLHNFFKLPPLGKSAFGFLQKQACFIEEMKNVMDWYRHMEELIKEKGLSRKTSNECKRYIHATFMQQDERLRNLGQMLLDYFKQEESLLESDDDVHNICSDIIESVFGYVKSRLSSNPNNGFTTLVLLVPAHLRVANLSSCKGLDVHDNMASTRLNDITKWRRDTLLANPCFSRARTMSMAVGF